MTVHTLQSRLLASILLLVSPCIARAEGEDPSGASPLDGTARDATAPEAGADDAMPAEPEDPLTPFLVAITRPAGARAVRALMSEDVLLRAPERALKAVGRLWHSGGPHAADALRELAAHRDPAVREAALRAIAFLALRSEPGSRGERDVRRALDDEHVLVRRAAYEAVGRVGVADDVPRLVEALASEEAEVRTLALRTLRTLTAERLSPDPARWAYWWSRSRETLEAQVEEALELLEGPPDELLEAQAWSVLERRSWVLPEQVVATASAWMRSSDVELRAHGYRLATAIRSLALTDDVVDGGRRDASGLAAAHSAAALQVYGLR